MGATGEGTFEITVLGSSDAFCSGGRLNAAYLFRAAGSSFLVDCGPTTLFALKQRGVDTGCLDFVIVSHMHGDHFAGLPFLLLEYMYENPRTRPFVIAGPADIEQRVWTLFETLYSDVHSTALPFALRFVELVPEQPTMIADVTVLPTRVPHQVEETSLALQLLAAGRRVLYSGDTPWVERFVELARGADLFLCECTAYQRSMGRHIEYEHLRTVLPRIAAKRLVLMHLGRDMRDHAASLGVECATEGLVIRL